MVPISTFPPLTMLIFIGADGDPSSPGTFVPVNMAADTFYPIVCNLAGQAYSKLFLANSPEGAKTLMNPDLRFILTGGVVTDCGVVQLISSQGPGYGV